ncbi:CRISPR-associated endoribonuclease Cas6 [Staphylospora marina]|uniref:CRISPR-associated endoribonuclease Cas6 n=1 Tax=Staphylospora marina TaxID=2490858 RepID=UPI000F5C2237|nr:CRISPR-associated endoribonuclease Cas6 [Staphylospora marina]
MRIEARFYLDREVALPYDINYPLASYIYQCIRLVDPDLGTWLHDKGLEYQGRSYKPFVFSRMYFESRVNKPECMVVQGAMSFKVDSILPEVTRTLVEGMWRTGKLRLLDVDIPLTDVRVLPPLKFTETMRWKALSPICVPVWQDNGLHFCHPLESRFYDSLRNSMKNWYMLHWKKPFPEDGEIHLILPNPEKFSLQKAAVLIRYKEKKIKGYQIPLIIQTTPEMQEVVCRAGLGSYGSQGFGMMEWWEESKSHGTP